MGYDMIRLSWSKTVGFCGQAVIPEVTLTTGHKPLPMALWLDVIRFSCKPFIIFPFPSVFSLSGKNWILCSCKKYRSSSSWMGRPHFELQRSTWIFHRTRAEHFLSPFTSSQIWLNKHANEVTCKVTHPAWPQIYNTNASPILNTMFHAGIFFN